jgi:hypothetical protein
MYMVKYAARVLAVVEDVSGLEIAFGSGKV